MSYYYPQAAVKLRILFEDFKLTSDSATQVPYEFNVIAKNVTVHRNDYKTTDTFDMEIDFKNFPFDPRAIRYCGVVIYMQDMGSVYNLDGSLNKLKPGAPTIVDPTITNAVFAGFVDEDTVTFDDTRRMVHFSGRDFTALLIDQKYQTNAPITNLSIPIDQVISTLLKSFAATQQLQIVNKTGAELPALSQYYNDFTSPMGIYKNPSGGQESYWDIIQKLASQAGLICYIFLDTLVLATPRNQLSTSDDIKFIYGQNVKRFELKRKLGRLKNFNIQVRSRFQKDVITANIPEEASPEWCAKYGIARQSVNIPVMKPDGSLDTSVTHKAPYLSFPIPNIGSKQQLIAIGQTIYEQYSLQQLEGSMTTMEMLGRGQSVHGNNKKSFTKYDLTQIKKGQTIQLEIDTDDLNKISRLTTYSARTQYLVQKNYNPKIAALFARTMGRFSPRFQIKSYTMDMNSDSGFKLDIQFYNILDLSQISIGEI